MLTPQPLTRLSRPICALSTFASTTCPPLTTRPLRQRTLRGLVFAVSIAAALLHPAGHADEPAIFSQMATAQPVWAKHGMVASQEM
ncbi:MAG: hypothetical protein ACRCVV_09890, partial [Shewanella sp.]